MMTPQAQKYKLSKNLLEMKFMKRTKEKAEQEQREANEKDIFESEITAEMKKKGNRFVMEPSYIPCEGLVFGRMSFGGMNPEIENMMKEKEMKTVNRKMDGISDKELAERYSTLIDTMAKKFAGKRKRNLEEEDGTSGESKIQRRFKKPPDD